MLSPRFEVRASLDLQYSDDYQPVDDNDPANIQDAFTKINARVELVGDDRWSVALLGKNLTDETVSNRSTAAEPRNTMRACSSMIDAPVGLKRIQ